MSTGPQQPGGPEGASGLLLLCCIEKKKPCVHKAMLCVGFVRIRYPLTLCGALCACERRGFVQGEHVGDNAGGWGRACLGNSRMWLARAPDGSRANPDT